MKATLVESDGYATAHFPYEGTNGITVIGNADGDEGGNNRVEIRIRDENGNTWRVWVETDLYGKLHTTAPERVSV